MIDGLITNSIIDKTNNITRIIKRVEDKSPNMYVFLYIITVKLIKKIKHKNPTDK